MNARRIPFQFSSTDPLVRQKELEKRFGLQPTCPKMYVDVNNPLSMGTTKATSSPRLQHRVPIFAEGYNHPIYSSSVDSMTSVPEKKPNVRIIPIEVEGADSRSPRHRNYSGPAGMVKDRCNDLASERNGVSPLKTFHFANLSKPQSPKLNAEPKVYNIPIKVEGVDDVSKSFKVDAAPKFKNVAPSANGCSQSKSSSKSSERIIKVQSEPDQKETKQPKSNVEVLLKKIEDVLTEFKTYETGVVEFSGTSKDKQYRYLDEMLTRCMLRLDNIETMGNEEIRLARKNAVKKIQASIDLLESKATVDKSTEIPEVQSIPVVENSVNENDSVAEMQDVQEDNVVASVENETSGVKETNLTVDDKVITNEANKSESKVETTQVSSLLHNIKDVVEIEMSETEGNNSSKINDKAKEIEDEDDFLKFQSNVAEIEMSEEISSDEVNSTNNAQLPDTLSNNKSIGTNEAVDNTTNDVEMCEEKISNEKESQNRIAQEENANEVTEIEMVEIGDVSSKDLGETIEEIDPNSDCSVETSHIGTGLPIDTEMKDTSEVFDVSDNSKTDQSVNQDSK